MLGCRGGTDPQPPTGRARQGGVRQGLHRDRQRREGRSPCLGGGARLPETGGTLGVRLLGRLCRSRRHLIETVADLAQRGIGIKSITKLIDTTPPGGKLVFHIFGALAQFEHNLIRERTHAGLAAAWARGRKGGRPKMLAGPKKVALAQTLYDGKQADVDTICKTLGISRAALCRSVTRSQGRQRALKMTGISHRSFPADPNG